MYLLGWGVAPSPGRVLALWVQSPAPKEGKKKKEEKRGGKKRGETEVGPSNFVLLELSPQFGVHLALPS